jgi:hypothetical protein
LLLTLTHNSASSPAAAPIAVDVATYYCCRLYCFCCDNSRRFFVGGCHDVVILGAAAVAGAVAEANSPGASGRVVAAAPCSDAINTLAFLNVVVF